MPNTSNLTVVIDNGSGITLSIVASSSGYLIIQMGAESMKLSASDAITLSNSISYAVGLRQQIPSS